MKYVRFFGPAVILMAILTPRATTGEAPQTESSAIFSRTAAEKLQREFASPNVSFLLYELRENRFAASQWPDRARAIPVGSLVKPFTALAYAESHRFQFPEHTCTGGNTCWLPKGHGSLGIERAVAFSCNSYFAALAANTGAASVTAVAQRYGLNGPGINASPEAMTGQFGVWRETPEAMVRAYTLLLARRSQPAIREIVAGMGESGRDGTAAGIALSYPRHPVLAKTGTAPCIHRPHAPGDGFVIVAWPLDSPRYLLLVREHGVPGALASKLAGRMLAALEPQP